MSTDPIKDLAARIDDLETRAAFQERTIEELNDTVAAQWKEIDRLSRQLARFESRLQEAIDARPLPALPEPPPPHY